MGRIREQNDAPSKKLITFDLDQEALKNNYPRSSKSKNPLFFKKAYKDIERFMRKHDFEHPQYSVYASKKEMDDYDLIKLMNDMAQEMPWLGTCLKELSVTEISTIYVLTGLFRANAEREAIQRLEEPEALELQEMESVETMSLQDKIKEAERHATAQRDSDVLQEVNIDFEL